MEPGLTEEESGFIPAGHLPADAVGGRQGPAGADQGAAAERIAILRFRPQPHGHLPRPRGAAGSEKSAVKTPVCLLFDFLKAVCSFCRRT